MLQRISRFKSIEMLCRTLPVLKCSFTTKDTALINPEELIEKPGRDIERSREHITYISNLIENMFLGILDAKALEYPEIGSIEEVNYMVDHKKQVEQLMLNEIKHEEIESTGKISSDVRGLLHEKDILGSHISQKHGGLGYLLSESMFVQESLSSSSFLSNSVAENENVGYQLINVFGSEDQKKQYLPKFLSGSAATCLAHLENGVSVSADPVVTVATSISDENYSISGEKTLVYNPNSADYIFVSAKTSENGYTLFMVDKNSKGVTIQKPLDMLGMKGLEICNVVFSDVIVSKDNIISEVNKGKSIMELLLPGKLCHGAQCIGLMRKLVNSAIKFCNEKYHFNKLLSSYNYINSRIGEMIFMLYAAESMTYLMTGRRDSNNDIDIILESFLIKVFNSEALRFTLCEYIKIMGRDNMCDKVTEQLLKDSYFYIAFDEPNGYLKHHLAEVGVKYVLKQMEKRTVKKYKPVQSWLVKHIKYYHFKGVKKTSHRYLHLMFEQQGELIDVMLAKLNFFTEKLIHVHGSDVLNRTYELNLLTDVLIQIYKTVAVSGRASRSLCIGLRNTDFEIIAARNLSQNAYLRTRDVGYILQSCIETNPKNLLIGKSVLENGMIPVKHPIELARRISAEKARGAEQKSV